MIKRLTGADRAPDKAMIKRLEKPHGRRSSRKPLRSPRPREVRAFFSCLSWRSNCCFLTCIQISQEAGQVVWYSQLLRNFPQFVVIHTVKGFGIVNKAEVGIFLELSCFFHDPKDVGNLICGSSAFSKSSWNIWKFMVHVLLDNFEYYLASM